ncbi:hypothetical protein D0862_11959 [Hortaea werneckii]|uniref:RhoGAP-domain-containing protein n=1 Tax=Hortaea werneckii TaxID=91943 RepID=A0A3M7F1C0_HORWE|nr:hypothetical protein D0862_11959 [Hortaea werneckii]
MAAIQVESPGVYDESLHDQEDLVYPCKGCGEILEEGKAFELAGNRWHIDCFRCNTCGTLLDSDANLLLLGDGSLICNNCTYSCNACGNKIEDLAILTGDQAFCAACFRCRNCKRKIENLRYARTSQGIFCMSCHESLMARRRKKAKTGGGTRQAQGGANTTIEKALPSLPPGAASQSAFTPDAETPLSDPYSDHSGRRSPRQHLKSKRDASISKMKRDVSPMSDDAGNADGPTLPASTYGETSRPSNVSSEAEDGEERGFLPMTFDPNPAPAPAPGISRKPVSRAPDPSPPTQRDSRPPKDYFFGGRLSARPPARDALRDERPSSSRSVSTERDRETNRASTQAKSSPHILYQEKGRQRKHQSGTTTPASGSATASPATATGQDGRLERPKPQHLDTSSFTLQPNEGFKLQDVPKTKKAGSRSSSKAKSSPVVSPVDTGTHDDVTERNVSPVSEDSDERGVNPFDDPRRRENAVPNAMPPPPRHADRPTRGDSLAAPALRPKAPTPEPQAPSAGAPSSHQRRSSASSIPSSFVDAQSTVSRDNTRASGQHLLESPHRSSLEGPPPRNSSRPSAPSKSVSNGDFIAPRAPPPPPPAEQRHKNSESISTMQSEPKSDGQLSPALRSAGLPKHADGAFSMEEEMTRIMRGEKRESKDPQTGETHSSMLRRVSNAVKHGRSFSDRGLSSAGKSSQSPREGQMEISSPMQVGSPSISSPTSKEPIEALRAVIRRQTARIAELEQQNGLLQEKANSSDEIQNVTTELRQKRDTMVVLDTQREMVVAELESMTQHLKTAKDSNQPLDLNALKTDILKDFAESLQRVKDQMSNQIEDLMHKRNELTDEIGTLIQMKDKGFSEYESLSSKNVQLLEMNNQLVHSIQETYKANRVPNGAGGTNGLGIYQPGAKPDTPGTTDVRNLNLVNTDSSMPNLLQETEAEPATVLTSPQVVNIRKGQPKKFNWRKGGEKMAKNVTKGLKGAFAAERVPERKDIGMPYGDIGMPYNQTQQATGGSDQGGVNKQQMGDGKGGAGFGWLGQKNAGTKQAGLTSMKNTSSANLSNPTAAPPSTLFGSELEARCDFEKRMIPSIVTRCVEEVESRGMDMEGIYRKSGGSGQVKLVQQGFEKDGHFDISDPDLDIHAVTSALKQYFRKLPTPLITYDVYETFLEAGSLPPDHNKTKQADDLRAAVHALPDRHRDVLEYLVQHLARVMRFEGENLMTPLNLSVVFAPTIMRPLSIEREMSDMQAQRTALQALLDQQEAIFGGNGGGDGSE